jgi:hypothetical protein
MAKFMLILHQTPGVWRNISAAEMQRKVERYQAWAGKIPFLEDGRIEIRQTDPTGCGGE